MLLSSPDPEVCSPTGTHYRSRYLPPEHKMPAPIPAQSSPKSLPRSTNRNKSLAKTSRRETLPAGTKPPSLCGGRYIAPQSPCRSSTSDLAPQKGGCSPRWTWGVIGASTSETKNLEGEVLSLRWIEIGCVEACGDAERKGSVLCGGASARVVGGAGEPHVALLVSSGEV